MKTFTLTFSEMRDKWLSSFNGKHTEIIGNSANCSEYNRLKSSWITNPDFYGGSPQDMVTYLKDGFFVDAMDNVDISTMPVRKRKRPRFNDCEGEFRYDLFEVGDENYFCDWTRREAIPGITVEFSTGFLASVSQATIAAYMRWIFQALLAIETAGIDAAIYAVNTGNGRLKGYSEPCKYRLEVKREGQINDFTNWSALFSPGGYRQLGFFTFHLMADHFNTTPGAGYGSPLSNGWNVKWNAEMRILEISHEGSREAGFPEQQMTEALISALGQARGN